MKPEELAKQLYESYCKDVGGKAYNGDDLPNWKDFSKHPDKQVQVNAWHKVADNAILLLNTEPKNYIDRLILELEDLQAKTDKLTKFLDSGKADELFPKQKNLLVEQHDIMIDYIEILEERIKVENRIHN